MLTPRELNRAAALSAELGPLSTTVVFFTVVLGVTVVAEAKCGEIAAKPAIIVVTTAALRDTAEKPIKDTVKIPNGSNRTRHFRPHGLDRAGFLIQVFKVFLKIGAVCISNYMVIIKYNVLPDKFL